jgi:4-hydroxybenzoate polyprenyltransferase
MPALAASDLAALVRLPAVLSVPGDILLGSAMTPPRRFGRTVGMVGSSALLYLGGMALNDWADREIDARERPDRPIPSGRVSPTTALAVAAACTAGGITLARLARGLPVSLPLAVAVWAYDLALKQTAAGPVAMATCRTLDVLAGAGSPRRRAIPAAALVGAHTAVVTGLSRQEASGGDRKGVYRAMAGTAAVSGLLLRMGAARARTAGGRRGRVRHTGAAVLAGAYAGTFGWAQLAAAREPSSRNLQRAVGTGVLGLMPLEASLLVASGSPGSAALVAGAWPVARSQARRRSVT